MLSSSNIPVTVAPEASVKLVASVAAPVTLIVPVVCMLSAKVICDESFELIWLPLTVIDPKLMFPVPFGVDNIIALPPVASVC